MQFLAKLVNVKFIFVYIQEAHADDVWPLGFGVRNPKSIEERIMNCTTLLDKFPAFRERLDGIFVDNMNNDFNNATGVWPEAYMFADSRGISLHKSAITTGISTSLEQAIQFAKEKGWLREN